LLAAADWVWYAAQISIHHYVLKSLEEYKVRGGALSCGKWLPEKMYHSRYIE